MIFTSIVVVATLIAGACIVLWWIRPDFRKWVEAPKYRFLDQVGRFDAAASTPPNISATRKGVLK